MNVPFREKMGSTAPSEVNIHVNGRVDSEGNSVTTYTLSDKYKEYVEATEKVHITKDGTVRVNLKYTVKESENSGSIMGSIKSRAYNAMVSSVESHVIGLYTSKRSLCFCKNPKCDIKTSEDFLRHFGEKY